MFARLLGWIREAWKRMITTSTVRERLGVEPAISSAMTAALELWSQMYANQAPWLTRDVRSLNLAAAIASEIARAVTLELQVTVTGSARADYLAAQLAPVLAGLREPVERGCAKGSLIFKPYVSGGRIVVDTVEADQFLPVAFDGDGRITAVIFVDQRQVGEIYYTRLEYHALQDGTVTIRNAAFRSSSKATIGSEVPLDTVPEWADLLPEATVTGVDRPLYGYFRYPLANNIDPASPLGVSCFSRATQQIRDADEIYSTLVWEFESGRRAIYVDELAFDQGADGKPVLPDKRLYRALSTTGTIGEGFNKLFEAWSPEFREAAIKAGLNDVKREIEFLVGLAYGTLSDPQVEAKTATEVKTSQQRSYATITDTQKALETALDDLLYAMDVLVTLNELAPPGAYEAAYDFDDSVVVDKDAQFQQDLRLVQLGLMSRVEFLMRNFRLTKDAAREKLSEIQAEQPEVGFFEEGA